MKAEIDKLLKELEEFKLSEDLKMKKAVDSRMYTEEHLKQLQSESDVLLAEKCKSISSKCQDIISASKKKFLQQVTKRPDNYDLKLNSTILLLSNTRESISEEEIKMWLSPFQYDYASMMVFHKIINNERALYLQRYDEVPVILKKYDNLYESSENCFGNCEPLEMAGIGFAAAFLDDKVEQFLTAIRE